MLWLFSNNFGSHPLRNLVLIIYATATIAPNQIPSLLGRGHFFSAFLALPRGKFSVRNNLGARLFAGPARIVLSGLIPVNSSDKHNVDLFSMWLLQCLWLIGTGHSWPVLVALCSTPRDNGFDPGAYNEAPKQHLVPQVLEKSR